jgi:hypothetical protein
LQFNKILGEDLLEWLILNLLLNPLNWLIFNAKFHAKINQEELGAEGGYYFEVTEHGAFFTLRMNGSAALYYHNGTLHLAT